MDGWIKRYSFLIYIYFIMFIIKYNLKKTNFVIKDACIVKSIQIKARLQWFNCHESISPEHLRDACSNKKALLRVRYF